MPDILKLIENSLAEGFADEEIAEMVYAIQDENRARMERMAQSRAALSDRPMVLLDNEPAWDLGGRRYAVMTETGAIREVAMPPSSAKPKRFK